jgi:tetratricopeptide (TPR) repeat protein
MRLERAPTKDLEALKAYRLGRYFFGLAQFNKSIPYFEQAITQDSLFAAAYAGLADASLVQGHLQERPTREYVPRVMQLVLKALEIDPGIAEAHTLLGEYFFLYNYDWASGDREFRRALELDPNSVIAHMWYGLDLIATGSNREAITELEKAVELDPASPLARIQLASGLRVVGRYQQAREELRNALEISPSHPTAHLHLGMILLQQGKPDSAVAELERGVQLGAHDADALSRLGHAYGIAGRKDMATRTLKKLLQGPTVDPLYVARVQLGLGNRDEALNWLERAYQGRSWELLFSLGGQDPAFRGLEGDPRFQALRKQVGLNRSSS